MCNMAVSKQNTQQSIKDNHTHNFSAYWLSEIYHRKERKKSFSAYWLGEIYHRKSYQNVLPMLTRPLLPFREGSEGRTKDTLFKKRNDYMLVEGIILEKSF